MSLSERWTAYVLYKGATNCYLQDVAHVREALAEVRPTVMCAVPRFYEKIFSAIHEKVAKAPLVRKVLFTWAVNMGRKWRCAVSSSANLLGCLNRAINSLTSWC